MANINDPRPLALKVNLIDADEKQKSDAIARLVLLNESLSKMLQEWILKNTKPAGKR